MSFAILTSKLLVEFTVRVNESPGNKLNRIQLEKNYYKKLKDYNNNNSKLGLE